MLSENNKRQQSSSYLQNEQRILQDLIRLQFSKKIELRRVQDYLQAYCSNKQEFIRQYTLEHDGCFYSFEKLLPITVQGERYMGLSQVTILFSPLFLKGIEKNLQSNLRYQEQRYNYLLIKKTSLIENENHKIFDSNLYSNQDEQFFLNFMKKYKDLPESNKLLRALMKPNYFCHSQISSDELLRSQLQSRGAYSNLFELYTTNPIQAIKSRLIQKVIGKNSLWGRYSQFSVSSHPFLTYCIRKINSSQYLACLFLEKIPKSEFYKKIRNPTIVKDLISNGFEQFLYIYYINVLEENQGEGNGRRIIQILKKTGLPLVLCSRATQKTCGYRGVVTTGQFYIKCGFTEYYPIPTQLKNQLDIGCLNLSKEHNKCIPEQCKMPMQIYPTQSYFVYYNKQK